VSPGAIARSDLSEAGPALADVLPSVATSLGVALAGRLDLPPAKRAVVVLVDGLGHELLVRRRGHAPFLRSLADRTVAASCGFPSTTATSMATFGTGLSTGQHGLLGYEVLDPARDQVFNELTWEDGPVPESWQPRRTVFEALEAAGVAVTRIGPHFFDGSGLTRAALRGGRFVAARSLAERVEATLQAVRATPAAVVYLYWGDVDKVGHVHGCESWQWGDELETVDRGLAELAARLPRDCSLTITADHGMVDCLPEDRLDVAAIPALAAGLRHYAGEPRAPQLHCLPGAVDDVRAAWQEVLGDRADVRTRADFVAGGLLGEVTDDHLGRVGDLMVTMKARYAVVDSRVHRPELIALVGLHGSTTPDEVLVPVVHLPAAAALG
jgi:hypothetical protein